MTRLAYVAHACLIDFFGSNSSSLNVHDCFCVAALRMRGAVAARNHSVSSDSRTARWSATGRRAVFAVHTSVMSVSVVVTSFQATAQAWLRGNCHWCC